MECNKDEAIRAKTLAEKKMETNDFEGARRMALKARNLFPELDNINQLLSVCDVHCSAESRLVGSEKDWYGILQVEKLADELTVKKQYRRLALNLHPDKNQLPGAEAAFKLISEANSVLSDPTRKSIYDSKLRVIVRSASVNLPPRHSNQSSQSDMQNLSELNISTKLELFWTLCPYCNSKYQYDLRYLHCEVRCRICSKNFIPYKISAPDVSTHKTPITGESQFREKGKPPQRTVSGGHKKNMKLKEEGNVTVNASRGGKKTGKKNVGSSGNKGTQNNEKSETQGSTNVRIRLNMKAKREGNVTVNASRGGKKTDKSQGVVVSSKKGDVNNMTPQKASSKINGVAVSSKKEDAKNMTPKRANSKINCVASEKSQESQSPSCRMNAPSSKDLECEKKDGVPKKADSSKKQNNGIRTAKPGRHSGEKDGDRSEEGIVKREISEMPQNDSIRDDIKSEANQNLVSSDDSKKTSFTVPDPDFSNFDKIRRELGFVNGEFWAVYDQYDGMPRYYAKITKATTSPFKVNIIWLEVNPVEESQKKWVSANLPVGCGNYKFGKKDEISESSTFSHQVFLEKGSKRGSLVLYPRKGEVWALFRDWDLSWSSNPKNHRECKYDIIEVLSDFTADVGIRVCYLSKVQNFVSLYQRSSKSDDDSFLIGPKEVYRFAHGIPYFKMSGLEREGVPAGSFELDTAALSDDLYSASKQESDRKTTKREAHFEVPNGKKCKSVSASGS